MHMQAYFMIRWPPPPTIMSPGVVELKGLLLSPLQVMRDIAVGSYWPP